MNNQAIIYAFLVLLSNSYSVNTTVETVINLLLASKRSYKVPSNFSDISPLFVGDLDSV